MSLPPVADLKVMSFGEHLEELRSRIVRSLLVTIFFALIALIFQGDLMSILSGPHVRSMQQVKGRRLAAELSERLLELEDTMGEITLAQGRAAIAVEEESAKSFDRLDSIAAERELSEPLASALYRLLREERRALVTGSGIAGHLQAMRVDLAHAKEDHAWGAGDSIEACGRHLERIEGIVAYWRMEPDAGSGETVAQDAVLETLQEVDETLVGLVATADRLHNWRKEKVPLRLLSHVEAFFSHLKLAFLVGILLGLPWITYEIWLFISAGLYQHERSVVAPFLPFSLVGLICGGMFAYHVLIPVGLSYLGGYGDPELFEVNFTLSNYMSLVFTLLIGMGLVFQLPLLMIFLSRSGIVTPEQFREVRKYSILGALMVGAFLTPPDVVTQMLMAVPLVLLYETGILASIWFRRRARKAATATPSAPGGGTPVEVSGGSEDRDADANDPDGAGSGKS